MQGRQVTVDVEYDPRSSQKPGKTMRGTKNGRPARIARYALAAGLLLAVLIRLTIRDGYPGISVVYYATPLGVLFGGSVLGVFASWRWSRQEALVWMAGCLSLLAWWMAADWQWNRPAVRADQRRDLRVLFWNVARWKDLSPCAEYIRQVDADIVALVEAGDASEQKRVFWKQHCPGYDVSLLGGGIQVLVKGSSARAGGGNFGHGCIYRTIPVQTKGTMLELCIVDLDSDPLANRKRPLQRLAQLADDSARRNLVIVGDFNCPADSVHLAPLRKHHRLAFEEVGFGYAATWPVPFPALELDQIWLGDEFAIVDCEHLWTPVSDHRPVLATIRLK